MVSIDGRLYPPGRARVSVFDRGFLYGDSIYEVLRTYGGRLFEVQAHLARLRRSAQLIGLTLPLSVELLRARMEDAVRASRVAEAYVRLIVTRGEGELGLDPALAVDPHVIVIARALHRPPAEVYRDGVEVTVVDVRRNLRQAIDPAAKTGNYLNSVLALRAARARGGYEALMLDAQGRVTEGSSSNVFVVLAGKQGPRLLTPPLQGILEGVTRGVVLDLARSLGLRAVEAQLLPKDLYGATELFLTSTIREIVPVVRVDGRVVGNGLPGPVTLSLRQAFQRRVDGPAADR